MALLDAADGESLDGFVQIVEQRKFLPRRHTPDEFDLELLHFGVGIGMQGAHNFSIAQSSIARPPARRGRSPGQFEIPDKVRLSFVFTSILSKCRSLVPEIALFANGMVDN